jgi:hypothetical protein
MERGVGYLMNEISGTAVDIEAIARLRPWIEEEAKNLYGYSGKTRLFTEYIHQQNIFKFTIIFDERS